MPAVADHDKDTTDWILHGRAAVQDLIEFLEEGERILSELPSSSPDRAMVMISTIRAGLESGSDLRKIVTELRDRLVAEVYRHHREVPIRQLADAAGFTDPYVSRTAQRYGAARRTVRLTDTHHDNRPGGTAGG